MGQLEVWKSIVLQSRNWKVICIALRHIEMYEKKEQARMLAKVRR